MRILILLCLFTSCSLDGYENKKDVFIFEIKGVMTADGLDTLYRDIDGYYHLKLDINRNQTIRRITGIFLKNGSEPIPSEKIEWESNLYWWILRNDTVAQITRTYFNPFTGSLQQVILPPLLAKKDELVPTVNCCSYSGKNGEINTMIAPINKMKGDTLIVQGYNYTSNSKVFTKIVLE